MISRLRVRTDIAAKKVPFTTSAQVPSNAIGTWALVVNGNVLPRPCPCVRATASLVAACCCFRFLFLRSRRWSPPPRRHSDRRELAALLDRVVSHLRCGVYYSFLALFNTILTLAE